MVAYYWKTAADVLQFPEGEEEIFIFVAVLFEVPVTVKIDK